VSAGAVAQFLSVLSDGKFCSRNGGRTQSPDGMSRWRGLRAADGPAVVVWLPSAWPALAESTFAISISSTTTSPRL